MTANETPPSIVNYVSPSPASGIATPSNDDPRTNLCMPNPYKKNRTPTVPTTINLSSPTNNLQYEMAPVFKHSTLSNRTNQGYTSGIVLYDQFASKEGFPIFENLTPKDIEASSFRHIAIKFAEWIANGNARTRSGQKYVSGHTTLPQYFSNWYNAVMKDSRFYEVLSTQNPSLWHGGMTENLSRRLTNASLNNGVNLISNNSSITRCTFENLIRHILLSSKGDPHKERDAWEIR